MLIQSGEVGICEGAFLLRFVDAAFLPELLEADEAEEEQGNDGDDDAVGDVEVGVAFLELVVNHWCGFGCTYERSQSQCHHLPSRVLRRRARDRDGLGRTESSPPYACTWNDVHILDLVVSGGQPRRPSR
jgi:hypothetical protein